jgi:tRNA C32,U32 (ribose-2'-O)-methylase TrmJ
MNTPWNWRIVLVRPRNPLNIGAAARAMANFGFRDLVVVNPYGPTWQETRSAVGAEDLVRSARAVPTLLEAIGKATLVVGTTAGSRRHLTRDLVPLTDFAVWLASRQVPPERRNIVIPARAGIHREKRSGHAGREVDSHELRLRGNDEGLKSRVDSRLRENDEVPGLASKIKHAPANRGSGAAARVLPAALLFGSEKTGLSNEEMSHCQALVRIPTSPGCPSMNLGQAVAVCCYELARHGLVSNRSAGARIHRSDPATQESLAHLFDRAARVLDVAGYLQPRSRTATLLKLREFLLELGLSNYDARILGGVLAQVEWKLGLEPRESEGRS